MFRTAARREAQQGTPDGGRRSRRGRHHHASIARERSEAGRRGRDAAVAPAATAAPAAPTAAAVAVGPVRIDDALARRDPPTTAFPAVPALPSARRALDGGPFLRPGRAPALAGLM